MVREMKLAMQQPMQQPLCLLELTATSVPAKQNGTQIDLFVTLDFHQEWQKLSQGRFLVGLRGGQLTLNLENAIMPDSERFSFEASTSDRGECQVESTGTETEPGWIFSAKRGTPVLQGSLTQIKLGTVQVTGSPLVIEATFKVGALDVQTLEAQGLWPHDVSPNQHSILERTLIRSLLECKLQPYVSRVELRFGDPEQPPSFSSYEVEADDRAFSQVYEAIAEILAADTNDLLELAKIANLNPLTDLAGANLLGTTLNEVDLTGANLEKANLRGADWNDVDLSGASLAGANLAGADFTGSLLSDVNLAGASLQRCSLALANLSGANLTNANLTEANLTNANLSDANLTDANLTGADLQGAGLVRTKLAGVKWDNANVKQARFKIDSGLSEEMEQRLKSSGAIVEHE
jgi:uncharacterized protein YjbI with pentapeptide repeats